jgi:RHS repeat-associated protein
MLSDGLFSEYIYRHDPIGQVVTSGSTTTATYAHADALSSVQLTTDAGGTQVGTTRFDAFGGIQAQTGVQLAFGFTGEQRDAESGLIYLRARYYDPRTGRFLTTDPVRGSAWRPASQHGYVYALNNPLRYRDPRGRAAGDGGCCDPAFGDAVGASAPAHEPVLSLAFIDPNNNPGSGTLGPCFTPVIGESCVGPGPVIPIVPLGVAAVGALGVAGGAALGIATGGGAGPTVAHATTKNIDYAAEALGVDRHALRDYVHDLKHENQIRGDADLDFDLENGDISYNGEVLGNVDDIR